MTSKITATTTVLTSPELLEALFLQCDLRSLLTSVQRVCRQWYEVAATSPVVQVHLYLRSAKEHGGQVPTLNPLLADVFPPFFAPLSQIDGDGTAFFGRDHVREMPLGRNPEPFMRPDATWRVMHVQQPPLRALGVAMPSEGYAVVHEKKGRGVRSNTSSGSVRSDDCEEGIRMGELYDEVVRTLTAGGLRWRILWRERVLDGGTQAQMANSTAAATILAGEARAGVDDDSHERLRELVREVDVVLVRSSEPLRSVSILPADRDFMAHFTHPNALRSSGLGLAHPRRVAGTISRREQREL